MRRTTVLLIAVALVLPLVQGCKAAPRVRPVKAGDVDTGAQSTEAVRRQFLGTWDLASLAVTSPAGDATPVEATGRMQYDEFGNLSMRGTITGNQNLDSSVLNVSGRIVIDPVTHTFRFQAVTGPDADARRIDPQLDAAHVRYYEFVGDQLKTTVKDAKGATTATATWKRAS